MKKEKKLFSITSITLLMLFPTFNFAQQSRCISKQPVTTVEQRNREKKSDQPIFPAVAGGCDTINYSKAFKTPIQWTAINWSVVIPGSGFVNGINSIGDKEKGNYIDITSYPAATHITGAFIWFVHAYSSNTAKTVLINVYDNGGIGGGPGALLGSQAISLATIMSNISSGFLTKVLFASPVAIPASRKIFITCDFTNLSWTNAAGTDSLNIVASDTLQENPGIVWEKTAANNWHSIDDGTSWNLKKTGLFMFPFISNNITPPSVTLNTTPANAVICAGNSVTFDPTGSVGPFGYNWFASPGYSGATLSGQNLVMQYNVANTYTVAYSTYGCGFESTAVKTVMVNPLPSVTASSNSPVCQNSPLQLNATSSASIFSWTGPNAFTSSVQNPVIALASTANNGTYTLAVINASSCTNSTTVNVVVNLCTEIDHLDSEEVFSILQNEHHQYFILMNTNKEASYSIYNINGDIVRSKVPVASNRVEINTHDLVHGMYFIQVLSGDTSFVKKIIITN